jgi:hypothetical protein
MRAIIAAIFICTGLLPSAFALTATNLSGFEGIEEPHVRYVVANKAFVDETFTNITDVGDNTVRMFLRFRPGQWWDGDRDRTDTSRQRAEVKGIGPHQKPGETFEYGTTWRTDPDFKTTGRFCHVFQIKATDGDDGAPLVTISLLSDTRAAVRYWSGNRKGFGIVREFPWKPGVWETVKIRVKTSNTADGEILVSVNGDEFKGINNVAVYRPSSTAYRPKWGLYRGVSVNAALHDDYVEHKNAFAEKLTVTNTASANSELSTSIGTATK